MKKLIAILVVAAAIGGGIYFAYIQGYLPFGGTGTGVPVLLGNADGVGALQVEISYDPVKSAAKEVKKGKLANNALVESNLGTPGRIVIGVVDVEGMKGDGEVAVIHFEAGAKEGERGLSVVSVEAYDAETRYALAPVVEDKGEEGLLIQFGKN